METLILPCRNPLAGYASQGLAELLDREFGRAPERVASIRVGFYVDGAAIQPGLHMIHIEAGLADGRHIRADGFIGDLRDVAGDALLMESLARLKEEISGGDPQV